MKKAVGLFVLLSLIAQPSLAQGTDLDKRNMHIFCASHLSLVGEALSEENRGRQALDYLAGMHREEAVKLGANQQHFSDVTGYLTKVKNNSGKKWARLSDRSKQVCLPGEEG